MATLPAHAGDEVVLELAVLRRDVPGWKLAGDLRTELELAVAP